MSFLLNIPIEVRLVLLFLVGVTLGSQLNRAVYWLAGRTSLGPWSVPQNGDFPARRWIDRLPVIGWWGLRRESQLHGAGYWIRPLLIELGTGIGFALLYWMETEHLLLCPSRPGVVLPDPSVTHAQFLSHTILISLMIVATFIDFDRRIIPDEITVTGTLLALLLVIAMPCCLLPTFVRDTSLAAENPHHMVFTSSAILETGEFGLGGRSSWPPVLSGTRGLWLALLGILAAYLAIIPKLWTERRGMLKAIQYLMVSARRYFSWELTAIAVVFSGITTAVWWFDAGSGGQRWQALLSSIIGMCFGGGLVWAVRIIGERALRMEAMGFGDVTLLAMIGAFLGWQAAFFTFFLAPITALLIATAQKILTGDNQIAFGPYLCLAAILVIVGWNGIWTEWAQDMFRVPWLIPSVLAVCLPMMGGMLWLWRIVRDAAFGQP